MLKLFTYVDNKKKSYTQNEEWINKCLLVLFFYWNAYFNFVVDKNITKQEKVNINKNIDGYIFYLTLECITWLLLKQKKNKNEINFNKN